MKYAVKWVLIVLYIFVSSIDSSISLVWGLQPFDVVAPPVYLVDNMNLVNSMR